MDLVCVPNAEGETLFPGEIPGLSRPTVIWDPNKWFLFCSNVAATSNGVFADLNSFQPSIVLIHELGHAKQWLENPHNHERLFAQGPGGIAEIEKDNLERHETPVAQELGLPVGKHYKHFPNSGHFGPTVEPKLLHAAITNADGSVKHGTRNRLF